MSVSTTIGRCDIDPVGLTALIQRLAPTADSTPGRRVAGRNIGSGPMPRLGQRVGHYRLVEALGHSGSGTEFSAVDERSGQTVAVKIVPGSSLSRGAARVQARALAQLSHPNVVPVFDVGVLQRDPSELPYLVMERVDGDSMRAWAHRHQPSTARLVALTAQVAGGLAHAHQRRIVHGDVRPDNILIDRQGTPRLCDFGLARMDVEPMLAAVARPDGSSRSGRLSAESRDAVAGTPRYMAPEVLRGARPSALSDQFALGVVLWELLLGDDPWENQAPSALATTEANRGGLVPLRSGRASAQLMAVLHRATAADPSKRYPTMTTLAHDLRSTDRVRKPAALLLSIAALGMAGAAMPSPTPRLYTSCAERAATIVGPHDSQARSHTSKRNAPGPGATSMRALLAANDRLVEQRADWTARYEAACQAADASPQARPTVAALHRCGDALRQLGTALRHNDSEALWSALRPGSPLTDGRCQHARHPFGTVDAEVLALAQTHDRGDSSQALSMAQPLAERLAQHDRGRSEALVRTIRGLAALDQGDAPTARSTLERAVEGAESVGDHALVAQASVARVAAGLLEGSLESDLTRQPWLHLAEATLERIPPAGALPVRADLALLHGMLSARRGEPATARDHFEHALELDDDLYRDVRVASRAAAFQHAQALAALGDLDGAIVRLELLQQVVQDNPMRTAQFGARPGGALGSLYAMAGDEPQAILATERSLDHDTADDPCLVAAALHHLAVIDRHQHHWHQAREHSWAAAKVTDDCVGRPGDSASVWVGLAQTHTALHEPHRALPLLARARTLLEQTSAPPTRMAEAHAALAEAHWALGRLDRAWTHTQTARDLLARNPTVGTEALAQTVDAAYVELRALVPHPSG